MLYIPVGNGSKHSIFFIELELLRKSQGKEESGKKSLTHLQRDISLSDGIKIKSSY
jgi:hypothetical protein